MLRPTIYLAICCLTFGGFPAVTSAAYATSSQPVSTMALSGTAAYGPSGQSSGSSSVPCCGGGGNALGPGQELGPGSAIGTSGYYVIMQSDGNLVEYTSGGTALWASDTSSEPGNYAVMQTDGNLVVYSSGGQWRWQSGTNGYGDAYFIVQTDGNIVVYSSGGTPLWARFGLSPQTYSQQLFFHYGWNASQQYPYLNDLWSRESNWRWYVCAGYPSGPYFPNCPYTSVAYGVPQGNPGPTMASAGPDWTTDALTQVQWGLNYIVQRYGNPYNAWQHELQYGWYAPRGSAATSGCC